MHTGGNELICSSRSDLQPAVQSQTDMSCGKGGKEWCGIEDISLANWHSFCCGVLWQCLRLSCFRDHPLLTAFGAKKPIPTVLIASLFLLLPYLVHLLYFCFSLVLSLPLPLCLPKRISLKSSPAASQSLLGSRLQGVGQSFTLKHRRGASKPYWKRKLLPPPVATWSNSAASETSLGCFSHQILPHKKKVTEVWLKGRWREGEENMFFCDYLFLLLFLSTRTGGFLY